MSLRTLTRRRSHSVLLVAALFLFGWTLMSVPVQEIWAILHTLHLHEIGALGLINLLVLLMLTGRWWSILRAQGQQLSPLRLLRYRLAAYGVSYFTPGPQFGGEPLQVYLLGSRHRTPRGIATASVLLDKALELLTNFAFLAIGALVLVEWRIFSTMIGTRVIAFVVSLLSLILIYIVALAFARRPLTSLLRILPVPRRLLPAAIQTISRTIYNTIADGEMEAARLCRQHPRAIMQASVVSAIALATMLVEYWLMARFLGINISLIQAVIALTAARIAFLLPFPGGLGALEASQTLIFTALGFPPAAGISVSLLIRARDVLLAGAGLWLGSTTPQSNSGLQTRSRYYTLSVQRRSTARDIP